MIEENVKRNSVGIDTGKHFLDVCRITSENKKERNKFKTDAPGLKDLICWLKKKDLIVLETGNQAFRLAKMLIKEGFEETYVLNAGELANIYNSLKKTDKEDALKLARLAARIPIEELPTVSIPSDNEEDARNLLKEQEFWAQQISLYKNKLHSIFVHSGITCIKKKDLSNKKNRGECLQYLEEKHVEQAKRICKFIDQHEDEMEIIDAKIVEMLKIEPAITSIAMSMTGIGPINALALFAYLGDCSRFSSGKQVGYYAGVVPRVDISGDTVRYGKITKKGVHQLRRTMIQGAWSCVRSKNGGSVKLFYENLAPRIGKKKAIVAAARKMLEIYYAMVKSGEYYRGTCEGFLEKKLRHYKVA